MVPDGGSSRVESEARAIRTAEQRERGLRLHHRGRIQAVVNAGDGIRVAFQPIVDLRNRSHVGHEALARLADGRPPNEWFTTAHDVGIGVELEMAAIARAVAEFGSTGGYLSINLSPATLTSAPFLEFLTERADPSRLVLELTEHTVVDDYDEIRSAIAMIRDLGARIAVDDAGSGISSMRHILRLAPEIIKLDRSLIATIDSDPARRALALSLAQFATGIGADLVAEGVERSEEMTACYESGVRYAQGYLLGRPGPIVNPTASRLDR
jgi:EAL domain-containing protein (putative c-di-GMP-specific phosphodiesterase class I)